MRTRRLFLVNVLLESFIIHIQVTHWFFFVAVRLPVKLGLEALVVNLKLILNLFLLLLKLFGCVTGQMSALDLLRVQSKFLDGQLVLLLSRGREPLAHWGVVSRTWRLEVILAIGEGRVVHVRPARNLAFILAQLT